MQAKEQADEPTPSKVTLHFSYRVLKKEPDTVSKALSLETQKNVSFWKCGRPVEIVIQ